MLETSRTYLLKYRDSQKKKTKTLPKSSPKKLVISKKNSLKCGDSFKTFQKVPLTIRCFGPFF